MIQIKAVSKSYGTKNILQSVSLELAPRQTHVLIGSSGCGKTTLLRIIIGLTQADSGSVSIDDQRMTSDAQKAMATKIGYVIQEGGLFPHLTAAQNVALRARTLSQSEEQISARIDELGRLVNLNSSLLSRYPRELSGGQRQRVSLMRALMLDPQIMLLDEPLGALDPIVRNELQTELREVFNRLNKTVVIVTHDMGEAAYFGHTITLLKEGQVLQHGPFSALVKNPASEFVTRFINSQRPPKELMETSF